MDKWLVVYRCWDDYEEESCFQTDDIVAAGNFIKTASPPVGFEHRVGSYFIEHVVENVV